MKPQLDAGQLEIAYIGGSRDWARHASSQAAIVEAALARARIARFSPSTVTRLPAC